ncbi:MAG: hypothetical protein WEC00_14255 [Dongiaceae bacterium]
MSGRRVGWVAGALLIAIGLLDGPAAAQDEESAAVLAKFNGLWTGEDKLSGVQVSVIGAETSEPAVSAILPDDDDSIEQDCQSEGIVLNCIDSDNWVMRLEPRTDGTIKFFHLNTSSGTVLQGTLTRLAAAPEATPTP